MADSVWTSGKAIHLTNQKRVSFGKKSDENTSTWCTDCTVSVLMSVNHDGRYAIMAKTDTGEALRLYEDKE